jgi:DNA (cytosine-5)-methyltransferase 1
MRGEFVDHLVFGSDLFCGCGGLSLGAMEAARAIGKRFMPIAAVDSDPIAIKVYKQNFPDSKTYTLDISEVLDGAFGSEPTPNERNFLKDVKDVEIALAGPPCQGYSSLNNHTRLKDARNALYERVARFAELVRPEHVLIENVPTVIHGREGALYQSIKEMSELGYAVDDATVDLAKIGVPQKRKRHIVVASFSKSLSVNGVIERYRVNTENSVKWAIEDVEDETPNSSFFAPSRLSEENMKRVKYLHENDIYVLPNWLRPDCHRNGHTYPAMYGRMRLNEPAQTVTCGFLSPGQGRFVHPTRLRTLTPHEAARLQFFPDYFDFSLAESKQLLSRLIGNATPWQLSYIFCLELLAS